MRVSIWQQFSSNHSADFTLVGEFKSAADASIKSLNNDPKLHMRGTTIPG